MGQVSNEQLGLWVGCLAAVLVSATSLIAAFRAMTKNFVTKDEMRAAMLELEKTVEHQLMETRHSIRNEMQGSFLRFENKLDLVSGEHSKITQALVRIETYIKITGEKRPTLD